MRYRKRPVVVEAWRTSELIAGVLNNWQSLPPQIIEAYEAGTVVFGRNEIHINTLEGTMVAAGTDVVICGVQGELYPCKLDIFDATYEPEVES